jgi:hypothetical protein
MNLEMDGTQQDCWCQGKIVAVFSNCDENHSYGSIVLSRLTFTVVRNELLISSKTFPYSRNLSASTNQQATSQECPRKEKKFHFVPILLWSKPHRHFSTTKPKFVPHRCASAPAALAFRRNLARRSAS